MLALHPPRRAAPPTASLACVLALSAAACSWDYGRFDPPPAPCDGGACADAGAGTPTDAAPGYNPCALRAGADRTTGPALLTQAYDVPSPPDDHTFDLRGAVSTAYPVPAPSAFTFGTARASRHLCVLGGYVRGQLDHQLTWQDLDNGNPGDGGPLVAGAGWYVVDGLRVENVWTGITLQGPGTAYVRNVYGTDIRNTCIDNAAVVSGYIEDSLFDGCHHGLTESPLTPPPWPAPVSPDAPLVLDGVLMHLAPQPDTSGAGGVGHGALFSKLYPDHSNSLVLRNSVFYVEGLPTHTTYPPTADDPLVLFPPGTSFTNVALIVVPTVGGPALTALPPNTVPPDGTPGLTLVGDAGVFITRRNGWLTRHGYPIP